MNILSSESDNMNATSKWIFPSKLEDSRYPMNWSLYDWLLFVLKLSTHNKTDKNIKLLSRDFSPFIKVCLYLKGVKGQTFKEYYKQTCQRDPRDRACAGRHAVNSICQRDWLRRQHNKFYQKSRSQKFLFFSRLKGDLFLNFCISDEKRYNQK